MMDKPTNGDTRKESDASLEQPSVDYAGASNKVDPEEIKLVRKLDIIVIVSRMKPAFQEHTHTLPSPFSGSSVS